MRRDFVEWPKLLSTARIVFLALLLVTSGLYIRSLAADVAAAWFTDPPLAFDGLPWQTQDASGAKRTAFRPGETVWVDADFTVGYAGDFRSQIQIVQLNGVQVRQLADMDSSIVPGHYQTNARAAAIPADLPPGRYRLEGTSVLKSWLRTVRARWRTTDFDVTGDG